MQHCSRARSHPVILDAFAAIAAMLVVGIASAAEPASSSGTLQFWFVRHAESELNVESISHTGADEGMSYPLTRSGVQQAMSLADELASVPIAAVYSSTRLRAIQTADAIAFRHGLNVNLSPEAVEIELGIANDAPEGRQLYRELMRKWVIDRDLNAHVGNGESFSDAQRRFLPFVRD